MSRDEPIISYAFCADVHVGNHKIHGGPYTAGLNDRCRETLGVFEAAAKRAGNLGARLIVLGDLIDSSKPEAQILRALQRIFETYSAAEPLVLKGNHESNSDTPGDNALTPLRPHAEVIDIIGKRTDGFADLWMVPSRVEPAKDWLPATLETLARKHGEPLTDGDKPYAKKRPRILCMHLGIEDDDTPPWLRGKPDSIRLDTLQTLCKKHKISLVCVGNWHWHRVWKNEDCTIVQCGSLCPTGWRDPGLVSNGKLIITSFYPGELQPKVTVQIMPGPRFLNVDGDDLDAVLQNTIGQPSLYLRVTGNKDLTDRLELLKANGSIRAYELQSDDAAARLEARKAANAAKSADTIEESVANYVEKMPLEEGVDRKNVLDESRGYLKL